MVDLDIERRWKFNGHALTDGKVFAPLDVADKVGGHIAAIQDLYLRDPAREIRRLRARLADLERQLEAVYPAPGTGAKA